MILLDKTLYGFILLVGEIATLAGVFLTRRLSRFSDQSLQSDEETERLPVS